MNLPKTYDPNLYEHDIYELWEKSHAFAPSSEGKPFAVLMPPPNANAPLHIGHALTTAIQDILIRYHRLKGESALYLPGADHAGFETWVVYEKKLAKEGKTRFDFTREELFQQVWDFVETNKGTMLTQTKALGASADWSRFTFTLDEKVVKSAYQTFKKLWDDDLIYRGERIVNYCTKHDTSFSDIEVEYEETKSKLWHIKYPLTKGGDEIIVATTRPETMLGDTAVAVNPKDDRYQKLIGKTIKLPLTNREIPIIADKEVDAKFGTGAVKVTPAHSQADFDIASRHDLPQVSVIGHDGLMTHHAPKKYQGLNVMDARKAVVEDLKKAKLIDKEEDYKNSIGHCYKCKTIIEPLLKEQWFVRMQPLAKKAIEVIKKDKIKFYPTNKKDHALLYLKNVRDWNISRQIAWGIPIPAFRNAEDPEQWIFNEQVDQEIIEVNGAKYVRDPDVFDTWFSSGQWPFVTLNNLGSDDFKRFYPTSVMETGGEIFNQWVLRMIMLGLYVTHEVPFTTVYIHGYVQAEDGSKMSKSLGNAINPMEVIDQYGSDALRMGLISGRVAGVASAYNPDKIVGSRNFGNKLWNIARFVEGLLGDNFKLQEPVAISSADNWIINCLNDGLDDIALKLDNYRFSESYEALYQLLWNNYADWYVEASKIKPNHQILAHTLKSFLIATHAFAPFLTETIWQTLTWTDGLLINQVWPDKLKSDVKSAQEFEQIRSIITEIRDLRGRLHLRENTLYHRGDSFIEDNAEIITKLAGIYKVDQVESGRGLHLTHSQVDAWIDVEHNVIKEYLDGLKEQYKTLEITKDNLATRLKTKGYTKHAPKELVSESKHQLEATVVLMDRLQKQIESAESSIKI